MIVILWILIENYRAHTGLLSVIHFKLDPNQIFFDNVIVECDCRKTYALCRECFVTAVEQLESFKKVDRLEMTLSMK